MEKIRVEDLTFSYDKETNAVEHVSFSIEEGSYTTIIGHNGSGKSTIAKLLIGLLDKDQGHIYVDQDELSIDTLYDIRDKSESSFRILTISLSALPLRMISRLVWKIIRWKRKKCSDIERFAQKVKMTEYMQSEPTKLSGGQKQRVAIAGVLAMSPQILIFDESTSMLDPQGKAEINELIQEIHKESNITIISITHDIEEVSKSDYVIVMDGGHVVMKGLPDDILRKEKELIALQLDIPFA